MPPPVIPWEQLATSTVPGGGAIQLRRRGAEYSITLGATELMNSRVSGSETALADLACRRLAGRREPRLLIGGLGMGFTLRAALAGLGPDARVVVAELVPAVVTWARGPLADLFVGSLDDARVSIVERDVGASIREARGGWDAILLDVDNGPDGLSREGNDALYGLPGLGAARRALRAGGLLGVWSVAPDTAFAARMSKAGFEVSEHRVRAAGRRGARHVVWLGQRP